jgi:hypothetical protein
MLSAIVQFLQVLEDATGGTWADGLRSSLAQMAIDTTSAAAAVDGLINMTYEQTLATAQNTGAQIEAAGAAAAVASMFQQMITNAPSGFKIGAYEYGATSTVGSMGGNPDAAVGGGTQINGSVTIVLQGVSDPEAFANTLGATLSKRAFQKSGLPIHKPGSPFP